MRSPTVVVIAKEPVPGRVKTRLCPPLTHDDAAVIAKAAILDTLDAALASAADDVVLALDGRAMPWIPKGVEVIPQHGDGLGERLASVFEDLGRPALVLGMDTPQVSPQDIDEGLALLARDDCDAVLGPAADGGYWSIGLTSPDRRAFDRVPMSRHDTRRRQIAALERLGLRVRHLRELVDVDHHAEARLVAAEAPSSRFAEAYAAMARSD
ncbi:TIGR04282 family arsenosugar biosynthesis glycosyltransferase [Dermatobacter hominis]|uniref:TIGR04282 family arsenosugar biosynthesis glycosyltransferase n=1 Tax=Dermatobacter hominis TaxID=2884263 RepID=UPI001D10443E|nr:TIGR04282 family arsenosugar biosynthesis glycosyltransferase [Dermatobacter hominis]UDY34931.1 glycosyltransferase [Dermatobacter hominis]